ncbi:MAG: hypothetical protein A2017_20360 [Lentisphaerae bacterium GWF2_44_16]|nr:MAG: hypothetical protein A2017_20360 [Lentisphaerae bacterium GWF2_44_16]
MNIREIAQISGFSASTVSRVIAGKHDNIVISRKTKNKILRVCKKYGYVPSIHASRFFSKCAKTIGITTPLAPGLDDDNLAQFMNAAYFELDKNDYRLIPLLKNKKFLEGQGYLNVFNRQEIDALIIWGIEGTGEWVDDLHSRKLPFILASNRMNDYPAVITDDRLGIFSLVEHCKSKGAKKFMFVSCPSCENTERRKEGFSQAVTGFENKIIHTDAFDVSSGKKAVAEIMKYKPEAVICGNDKVAIGVLFGLRDYGVKVPDDMLITGADNIEMSEYCPVPLTTFDQRAYDCGTECIKIIMKHLKDGKPMETKVLKPAILIRESA